MCAGELWSRTPSCTFKHMSRESLHCCSSTREQKSAPSDSAQRLLLSPLTTGGPTPRGSNFGCPRAVVAGGIFLFYSLSLSRHFVKSASLRKKTDGSGRFRFRAREQTAASRAIFATLFAFQVGATDPLVGWPAPLWNAAGSNVRLGNYSASRSSCQRREPAHAAQRPRHCCLRSSRWLRLPVPGVSRILRVRSGWAEAVCWDLPE